MMNKRTKDPGLGENLDGKNEMTNEMIGVLNTPATVYKVSEYLSRSPDFFTIGET